VKHDDFFETVRPFSGNPTTTSTWQTLAGFKAATKLKPSQRHEQTIKVSEGASDSQPLENNDDTIIPAAQELPDDPLDDLNNQVRVENQNQDNLSRYGRVRKPTQRMQESLSQRQQGVVAYSTSYEVLHEDDYLLQDQMSDPIAFFSAQGGADTMYFDQAMQQEDRELLNYKILALLSKIKVK
jgi:hypothetical protein